MSADRKPHCAKLIGIAAALAMLAIPTSTAWAGGRGDARLSIPSPRLGRDIPVSIYRSPGAMQSGRLPLLLLLHGHGDDDRAWLDKGDLATTADRLAASGAIKPMLVAMPAAGNSWYVDDAQPHRYGPVRTAFTTDLVDAIEARLPAGGCREMRATGGLSMGGYGAVLLALDRSDRFVASFSLSGSLFSDQPADIERRRSTYERLYDGVFGRPFDSARFLADNVFVRLTRLRTEMPRPAFWLAAGNRDYPSILAGTQRFHVELDRAGLSSELRLAEGEHTWDLWKADIEKALIWVSAHLSPACGKRDP